MKILKKMIKWLLILIIGSFSLLALADAAWIFIPQFQSQKQIPEVNQLAQTVSEMDIADDVKIVGLGEASHGNVEFQELKLTVLKNLVEKEHVRAFALETDFSEGLLINDYIHSGNGHVTDIVNNLAFPIYRTKQIQNLIEWMRKYNQGKPASEQLSFYGFDMQNPEKGIDLVVNYCLKENLLSGEELSRKLNPVKDTSKKMSSEEKEQSLEILKKIQSEIENKPSSSENRLMERLIRNILDSFDYYQMSMSDFVAMNNARDAYMAANVSWIQKYEEEKGMGRILIAGHNGHVAYQDMQFTTMGSHLREQYQQEYFVIGTDYFHTSANIKEIGKKETERKNHSFTSADPLAAQAKRLGGSYYLDFHRIEESSDLDCIISQPMTMGSLGEGYSFLMHFLPSSHRIQAKPKDYYDAMVFIYQAHPIQPFTK